MLEMYKGVANSPETTITNDINNLDTIIYVLDETRIPVLPNIMVLGNGISAETVKVLSIAGNALTVERGFQGVPKSWNAGTIIARNFTEYDYDTLVKNIEELNEEKTTPAVTDNKVNNHNTSEFAHQNIQQELADAKSQLNEITTDVETHMIEDVPHQDAETLNASKKINISNTNKKIIFDSSLFGEIAVGQRFRVRISPTVVDSLGYVGTINLNHSAGRNNIANRTQYCLKCFGFLSAPTQFIVEDSQTHFLHTLLDTDIYLLHAGEGRSFDLIINYAGASNSTLWVIDLAISTSLEVQVDDVIIENIP